MKNEFYGNIGQLVQAGTANVSVNATGESVWQMFGHCSDDEILQIKEQVQNEIVALKHKGLQCGLSGLFVILTYAGLFYFDVYQRILGVHSVWGMGVAVLCLVAWVSTMGNAIKHDINPQIDKLKKDCECLDDILRYRKYLLSATTIQVTRIYNEKTHTSTASTSIPCPTHSGQHSRTYGADTH